MDYNNGRKEVSYFQHYVYSQLTRSISFDHTFCLVDKCFVSSICKFHNLSVIFYLIRPLMNTVNVLISPNSKYKRLPLNADTGPIVTNKLPY